MVVFHLHSIRVLIHLCLCTVYQKKEKGFVSNEVYSYRYHLHVSLDDIFSQSHLQLIFIRFDHHISHHRFDNEAEMDEQFSHHVCAHPPPFHILKRHSDWS